MSAAVFLSEPEPETRGFLERHLLDDGFDVLAAADPIGAADADLVLLGDAAALEEWQPRCPVIVLGRPEADAVDRVRAFQRGCDDYLARPFHYDELVARMRAVLRRSAAGLDERVRVGDLVVDRGARSVTVAGHPVALSGKEYALLVALSADPTRVFTKADLLRDVWGFRSNARTRTLDSHASRTRRKLAAAGGCGYVVNVWGVGYKLID